MDENPDTDFEKLNYLKSFYSKLHGKNIFNLIRKYPVLFIIILFLLLLLYHPFFFNLTSYYGNSEQSFPLKYVSNFHLWNRRNSDHPTILNIGTSKNTLQTFFQSKVTYVIIHGFLSSWDDGWIIALKNALLWRKDCNVISVDWQAGSLTVGYYVIQARVPDVGEDLAQFIRYLNSQADLPLMDIHVIGHSLGAHVAGYAGKYFNGTIGRITGMDPAGLNFNNEPAQFRLDKSDAQFVDVIHTHGCYTIIKQFTDCYGTYQNIGHADFWPNGGEDQPACEYGDGVQAVKEGSNCHHGMVYAYFISSIYFYPSSTRFLARPCSSWKDFNNDSCACSDGIPQYMGFNADYRVPGIFYLNTSNYSPYGLLEPSCSPTSYSVFKLTGILMCIVIALLWLSYNWILFYKKEWILQLQEWSRRVNCEANAYISLRFKKHDA